MHGREGAIRAVLLEGVSVAFSSFCTVLVFWLSHNSGDQTRHSSQTIFNNSLDDTPAVPNPTHLLHTQYGDKDIGVIALLLLQYLIEGVFMSSAVGVPSLVAYLARRAETQRIEREQEGDWEEGRSQATGRRRSCDTLTSNEMRGILEVGIINGWGDEDTASTNTGGRQATTVVINHHIEYDPPPPPPIPHDQIRSCLKYSTRPAVVQATRAQITAVICLLAVTAEHIEQERQKKPLQITLPPRRAAMLCVLYGFARFLSTLCQYNGIVNGVGLTTVAVLTATAPIISSIYRTCRGGEAFNKCHVAGFVLSVASVVMVAFGADGALSFVATFGSGVFAAAAHLIYNAIRPQVHPFFLAMSFNVVGSVVCGFLYIILAVDLPGGQQWSFVMILSVLSLIADTALANGAPESQYIPVGFARAVAIALALGMQTVVLEDPPSSLSSFGAILAFSAYVLLEIGRMSAKNLPYVPLSALQFRDVQNDYERHNLNEVDDIQFGETAAGCELGSDIAIHNPPPGTAMSTPQALPHDSSTETTGMSPPPGLQRYYVNVESDDGRGGAVSRQDSGVSLSFMPKSPKTTQTKDSEGGVGAEREDGKETEKETEGAAPTAVSPVAVRNDSLTSLPSAEADSNVPGTSPQKKRSRRSRAHYDFEL